MGCLEVGSVGVCVIRAAKRVKRGRMLRGGPGGKYGECGGVDSDGNWLMERIERWFRHIGERAM